jgi:hypothetical protein
MNEPAPVDVEKVEGTFEFVKSRIDDVEKVVICAPGARIPGALISGDFTMIVYLVTGKPKLVFRNVAEKLLNDGMFYRLRIPVEFMPIC